MACWEGEGGSTSARTPAEVLAAGGAEARADIRAAGSGLPGVGERHGAALHQTAAHPEVVTHHVVEVSTQTCSHTPEVRGGPGVMGGASGADIPEVPPLMEVSAEMKTCMRGESCTVTEMPTSVLMKM